MGEPSEDSVEAEFGGDYSEGTIDLIRSLGKPGAKFGDLAPEEEAALQPPPQALCDAAVERLRQYERELEEVAQHVPDERERQWVEYKRTLVEDVTPEEITWLKLRAYHRGMDTLHAPQGDAAAMGTAGLPHADAADGASISQQPAFGSASSSFPERDAVLAAVSQLLPSTSSEEEDQDQYQDTAATSNGGFLADRLASHAAAGPAAATALTPAPATAPAASPTAAASAAAATAEPSKRTVYTASYLEEQLLVRRVAEQQRQRSQAFALSLTVALGASVARWWLRRKRGPKADAAAARQLEAAVAQ